MADDDAQKDDAGTEQESSEEQDTSQTTQQDEGVDGQESRDDTKARQRDDAKQKDAVKPPWGSDDDFDPKRAWSLIQNLRKENEDLKPLAKKGKDLEDAGKTELERLRERTEAAEKAGTETSSKLWRLEIAVDKGLSKSQAKRLVGNTREELEADADELLEDLKGSDAKGDRAKASEVIPSKPKDGQKSGGSESVDPKRIAKEAMAHYR